MPGDPKQFSSFKISMGGKDDDPWVRTLAVKPEDQINSWHLHGGRKEWNYYIML